MKFSDPNSESSEFNLNTIYEKCCRKGEVGPCGDCESCVIDKKIKEVQSWLVLAGDQTRRRCLLGLVRRIYSTEALNYLSTLLHSVLNGKDYTYARTRTNPSLDTDRWTTSGDRMLKPEELDIKLQDLWKWFELGDYYRKLNFLLKIMTYCEVQLVWIVLKQIQTQFVPSQRANKNKEPLEVQPLKESDYSFHTAEHSELDLLISTKSHYGKILQDPFKDNDSPTLETHPEMTDEQKVSHRIKPVLTVKKHAYVDKFPKDNNGKPWTPRSLKAYRDTLFELTDDKELLDKSLKEIQLEREEMYRHQETIIAMSQGDKKAKHGNIWQQKMRQKYAQKTTTDTHDILQSENSLSGKMSPECYIIPTTNKAHVGVSQKCDFIAQLPVHISKYILSMLSVSSVRTCLHVSPHWQMLASEVLKERTLCNQIKLEVKQLQVASRGCNPLYAKDIDVLVPNLTPGSNHCLRLEPESSPKTTSFPSVISLSDELHEDGNAPVILSAMQKAYEGYSTRKIIMEERNVYCGAFNVMILADLHDTFRVVHYSGGRILGQSFMERRIMFLDCKTGQQVGPIVLGHAGTIRCLELLEKRGLIFSGSYDTSIRCWSLVTGKCQKIYRGHNGTVTCLHTHGTHMISGGRDGLCKVWDILSGNCLWTFRQQNPITAVQLGEDICVNGSEDSKVYVWDIKTGNAIKKLTLHKGTVTAVKLDKWHIVTSSVDGFVYMWSTQGDHDQPLAILKHNSPVLSLEFLYLRIITGSSDGKLRIWNALTGQCIRILRGNSKNEPIYQIIATHERLILNTPTYLLALNFEPVELEYDLENDSMPPLVKYASFDSAPVREQPYPYVRAQRMRLAGAANRKLMSKSAGSSPTNEVIRKRVTQLPHSAKLLSEQKMEKAKRVQSGQSEPDRVIATSPIPWETKVIYHNKVKEENKNKHYEKLHSTLEAQQKVLVTQYVTPEMIAYMKLTGDLTGTMPTDDEDSEDEEIKRQRRMSWTFEQITQEAPAGDAEAPEMPSLDDTKLILRTQMRQKNKDIVPEFIQQKISSMHANLKQDEMIENVVECRRDQEIAKSKQTNRPTSSPGWIDPRAKVSVLEQKNLMHSMHLVPPSERDESRNLESRLANDLKIRKTVSANVLRTRIDNDAIVSKQESQLEASKVIQASERRRMSCAEYRNELKMMITAAVHAASTTPAACGHRPNSETQIAPTSALKKNNKSRIGLDTLSSTVGANVTKSELRVKLANDSSALLIGSASKGMQNSGFLGPPSTYELSVDSNISTAIINKTVTQRSVKSATLVKELNKDGKITRAKTASSASVKRLSPKADGEPRNITEFIPILFYPKEVKEKVEQLKLRQQRRQGFAVSTDFFEDPQDQIPNVQKKKKSVYADVLRRESGFRLLTDIQIQEQIATACVLHETEKREDKLDEKKTRDESPLETDMMQRSAKSVSRLSKQSSDSLVDVENEQRNQKTISFLTTKKNFNAEDYQRNLKSSSLSTIKKKVNR